MVEAWNADGGSCSYGSDYSLEEAAARARRYSEHGDDRGTRYDH